MRRGTTVTNTFAIDIDLSDAAAVFITYKQAGYTIIEKTIDDITITEDEEHNQTLSVDLSQVDTLAFAAAIPVQIQIRARLVDDSAVASNIINTNVGEILKDGVI